MAGVPDKDFCSITLPLLGANIECHDMGDEMRNFNMVRINPVIIPGVAVFAIKLAITVKFVAHCRRHGPDDGDGDGVGPDGEDSGSRRRTILATALSVLPMRLQRSLK